MLSREQINVWLSETKNEMKVMKTQIIANWAEIVLRSNKFYYINNKKLKLFWKNMKIEEFDVLK